MEDLADPQIQPPNPPFEQRLRRDQRHGRRPSAACQRPPERCHDLVVRRRVVGVYRWSRQILVGRAEHRVAGQRHRPVDLDLRLGLPRPELAAVQQLLGRVDHEALILDRAPRVHTAADLDAVGEPPVEADLEEVVRQAELAEVLHARDQVLDLPELVRLDVVEAADLVAAASRQPRVHRRGDAVGVVVVRRHQDVVGQPDLARPERAVARSAREVPAGVVVVPDAHRQPLAELLLHLPGHVPVVVALSPAAQDIGVPPHGIRVLLAEVRVVDRAALPVGAEVPQVAIRHVVAVGVVPGPVREEDRRVDRVVRRRHVRARLPDIAPHRELDRGPPVPEQVVGGPEARAEVPPRRHVAPGREVHGREPRVAERHARPGPRVGRPRERLRRHVAVHGVEARAEVQRQPVDRPLILRVDPDLVDAVLLERRRGMLPDPQRHAVAEPVLGVRGPEEEVVPRQVLVEEPRLEVVRSGDVRERPASRVPIRVVGVAAIHRTRAVADARSQIRDPHHVRRDARHEELVPLRDGHRRAGLQQQAARLRRRPRALQQSVGVEPVAGAELLHAGRVGRAAVARPLLVVGEVDLVPLRRLPGDPAQIRVVPLEPAAVAVVRPVHPRGEPHDLALGSGRREKRAQARRRRPGGGVLVPEDAVVPPREAPAPPGHEVPHAVPQDRAAQAQRLVPHLERLVRSGQAARLEVCGQVLALHAVVGEEAGRDPAELVAPFLGNDVDHRSVGVRVRPDAARLEHHLLDRRRVDLVAAVPRGVLHAHAVERHLGAPLPVERAAHLRAVPAAHVGQTRESGSQGDQVVDVLRAHGQRRQHLVGHERLPAHVLHVDDGGRPGDGDRLFDPADRHGRVDVRRESGGQLDPLPDDRAEAGQRERDRVDAGPQVDDGVEALTVGDGDPLALDEGRARGGDGDAGQHAAGIVRHRAGDALRGRCCRRK